MLWSENRTREIEIMEVWVVDNDEISVMAIKSTVEDEGRM